MKQIYSIESISFNKKNDHLNTKDYLFSKIIEQSFNHKAYSLNFFSNHITISFCKTVFNRSFVTLPYINYVDFKFNSEADFNKLLEVFSSLYKNFKLDFIELRFLNKITFSHPFIEKTHKVTFILELKDSSLELFNTFSAKVRNQIRKTEKENLKCEILTGNDFTKKNLGDFYKVFSTNMRDLGTPVYPKKFFKFILENFKDNAILGLVEKDKKVIGGSITIIDGDTAEILWASTLKKYNKICPNMLLYFDTMKYLIQREIKFFDFGRTTPNSGSYNFKKQWGGKEIQLYWYYYSPKNKIPNINPENKKFSLAISVWKRLPLWFTNFLGPILTRHLL